MIAHETGVLHTHVWVIGAVLTVLAVLLVAYAIKRRQGGKLLTIAVFAVGALALMPAVAFAQEPPPNENVAVGEVVVGDSWFDLSPWVVSGLVGTLIPLLTAVITKWSASHAVKGVVTTFFSALSAVLVSASTEDGNAVISQSTLVLFFITWAASAASYYNLWKPTTIAARVNDATPGVIGPPGPAKPPVPAQ